MAALARRFTDQLANCGGAYQFIELEESHTDIKFAHRNEKIPRVIVVVTDAPAGENPEALARQCIAGNGGKTRRVYVIHLSTPSIIWEWRADKLSSENGEHEEILPVKNSWSMVICSS